MNKYIDAEKLKAEIKALKHRKGFLPFENTEITEAYMARGVQFTCDDIVNLITILQQEQPDADFEKAYKSYMQSRKDDLSGNAVTVNMKDLARYFYYTRK